MKDTKRIIIYACIEQIEGQLYCKLNKRQSKFLATEMQPNCQLRVQYGDSCKKRFTGYLRIKLMMIEVNVREP